MIDLRLNYNLFVSIADKEKTVLIQSSVFNCCLYYPRICLSFKAPYCTDDFNLNYPLGALLFHANVCQTTEKPEIYSYQLLHLGLPQQWFWLAVEWDHLCLPVYYFIERMPVIIYIHNLTYAFTMKLFKFKYSTLTPRILCRNIWQNIVYSKE